MLKKIFKIIASVFLVLLVTLCIYTFIVTDIMKKDYVNVFGYTYFVVATGSMSGTIEVDDIIFVKLTDEVYEGDIITYQDTEGDIITHRLVDIRNGKYIAKGDVNNTPDQPITKNQIIGKVSSIISPSFLLKSIAIFLILFIFLALINFDELVKKFVFKEEKKLEPLPDDLFINPKRKKEEPSTGLTVTISLEDMERLNKEHQKEIEAAENIEILSIDEYLEEEPPKKKDKDIREKETVDLVLSILKCKKNNITKSRMNKKWLTRYHYIYKLCHLLLNGNTSLLVEEVNNPPFSEIYDYDLERVGLTEIVRNKIYDLSISVFLRVLTYAVLYNDDEMFDGIYKIFKYKVMIDKDNYFKEIKKGDSYNLKQLKTLIIFMKRVSNKFDNKNVFELEKIERIVKIGNY